MDKKELVSKIREFEYILDDYGNYNFNEDGRWESGDEFLEELSSLLCEIALTLEKE